MIEKINKLEMSFNAKEVLTSPKMNELATYLDALATKLNETIEVVNNGEEPALHLLATQEGHKTTTNGSYAVTASGTRSSSPGYHNWNFILDDIGDAKKVKAHVLANRSYFSVLFYSSTTGTQTSDFFISGYNVEESGEQDIEVDVPAGTQLIRVSNNNSLADENVIIEIWG